MLQCQEILNLQLFVQYDLITHIMPKHKQIANTFFILN